MSIWIKPHGDCKGGRHNYCDIDLSGTWHICHCGHKARGWDCYFADKAAPLSDCCNWPARTETWDDGRVYDVNVCSLCETKCEVHPDPLAEYDTPPADMGVTVPTEGE